MLESGVMGVDLPATQITHIIHSHLNAAASSFLFNKVRKTIKNDVSLHAVVYLLCL